MHISIKQTVINICNLDYAIYHNEAKTKLDEILSKHFSGFTVQENFIRTKSSFILAIIIGNV